MSHLPFQILPDTSNRGPHSKEKFFLSIRNRYRWLLDMGGEKILLFKRKYAGTRCPNYDQIRKRDGQHEAENPPICYGTGFVGGYFKPMEIVCSLISGSPEQAIVEEWGRRRIFIMRSWTLWEPLLSNGDLLVRRDGKRFWITEVIQRRWKHYVTRQDFSISEVERNHPVYSLPI